MSSVEQAKASSGCVAPPTRRGPCSEARVEQVLDVDQADRLRVRSDHGHLVDAPFAQQVLGLLQDDLHAAPRRRLRFRLRARVTWMILATALALWAVPMSE